MFHHDTGLMTDGEFDQSTENNTLNYPLVVEHFQRANFQFDPSKRHREIARAEHNASSTGSGGDFATLNRALNRSSAVASSRADDRDGSFSFRQFFRKLASDSSLQTRSNLHNKDLVSELLAPNSSSGNLHRGLGSRPVFLQLQRGTSFHTSSRNVDNNINIRQLREIGRSKSNGSSSAAESFAVKRRDNKHSSSYAKHDEIHPSRDDEHVVGGHPTSTGTTFVFPSSKKDQHSDETPKLQFESWQRVLVVDSSAMQRRAICDSLRQSGICSEPLEARDGMEALTILARSRRESRRRSSSASGQSETCDYPCNKSYPRESDNDDDAAAVAIVVEVVLVGYEASPSGLTGPATVRALRDAGYTGLILGTIVNSESDLLNVERFRQFRASGANTALLKPIGAVQFAKTVMKFRNKRRSHLSLQRSFSIGPSAGHNSSKKISSPGHWSRKGRGGSVSGVGAAAVTAIGSLSGAATANLLPESLESLSPTFSAFLDSRRQLFKNLDGFPVGDDSNNNIPIRQRVDSSSVPVVNLRSNDDSSKVPSVIDFVNCRQHSRLSGAQVECRDVDRDKPTPEPPADRPPFLLPRGFSRDNLSSKFKSDWSVRLGTLSKMTSWASFSSRVRVTPQAGSAVGSCRALCDPQPQQPPQPLPQRQLMLQQHPPLPEEYAEESSSRGEQLTGRIDIVEAAAIGRRRHAGTLVRSAEAAADARAPPPTKKPSIISWSQGLFRRMGCVGLNSVRNAIRPLFIRGNQRVRAMGAEMPGGDG